MITPEKNTLNLSDSTLMKMHDKLDSSKGLRGHLVIVDNETGKVVVDKDNLVLMRGRTFALEKLFSTVSDFNPSYNKTNLDQKKICLFKVGKGGCVEGEPFTVKETINPLDTDLYSPVPFRILPTGSDPLPNYADLKNYEANDGNTYNAYYCKRFDDISWVYNETSNDEVAIRLTLNITEDDLKTVIIKDENNLTGYTRSTFINELGLCIANINPATNEIVNGTIELVTKICFSSEPYFNPLKSSTLYYYIYA